MAEKHVVIIDCNYNRDAPHAVFVDLTERLLKDGISLTVDNAWSDDYLAADLLIGADPLVDDDKLLDSRILGQRTLNRRTRLDVAVACNAHVAPFGGPRNDRELDDLANQWNTDTAVLKYDWSARRNGVFLWPLAAGRRSAFPADFDPACDVFMAFQNEDPHTYKIDTFAGVLLGAYVLPTRDMRETAWQIIGQREHLLFEPDARLAEQISLVSRSLLKHGAGYTSFDLMRSRDSFFIIEMNTSGVGTATWNDWPEQYAARYSKAILAALDQIDLIPRYRDLRATALRLGNDLQAPVLPQREARNSVAEARIEPGRDEAVPPELAFLQTLAQSEQISSRAMRDFISSSIERLLGHARTQCPFYQNRLDAALRADGTIDWSGWSGIALLHRADIVENRHALLARSLPAKHGSVSHTHTSGTRFEPVTVSRSRLSFGVASSIQMRGFAWHQVPVADRMATIGLATPLAVEADLPWAPAWVAGERGAEIHIPTDIPIEDLLIKLRQSGPVWLRTRPSVMQQMALAVCGQPQLKPDLLGVFTEGEILTPDQRQLCASFLGHNPIDRYSLREVWDVALQCPASTDYHVQTEAIHTELLNNRNQPCRQGELGRIVVTSLYNLAMPIIRYDTGDYAIAGDNFSRFSGRFCRCGKRLLRLQAILGRRRNLLRHTLMTGRHPALDSLRLFELSGASLWQLVELASGSFKLRLCTERSLSAADKRAIADCTNATLGSDNQIAVESSDQAAMSGTGKFEMFLSQLPRLQNF